MAGPAGQEQQCEQRVRAELGDSGEPQEMGDGSTHTPCSALWVDSLATVDTVSVPSSREGERDVWSARLQVWGRGSRAKAKLEGVDEIGQRWKSERKFCPRRMRGPRVVFSS